jgi:hypothetical protein
MLNVGFAAMPHSSPLSAKGAQPTAAEPNHEQPNRFVYQSGESRRSLADTATGAKLP